MHAQNQIIVKQRRWFTRTIKVKCVFLKEYCGCFKKTTGLTNVSCGHLLNLAVDYNFQSMKYLRKPDYVAIGITLLITFSN